MFTRQAPTIALVLLAALGACLPGELFTGCSCVFCRQVSCGQVSLGQQVSGVQGSVAAVDSASCCSVKPQASACCQTAAPVATCACCAKQSDQTASQRRGSAGGSQCGGQCGGQCSGTCNGQCDCCSPPADPLAPVPAPHRPTTVGDQPTFLSSTGWPLATDALPGPGRLCYERQHALAPAANTQSLLCVWIL